MRRELNVVSGLAGTLATNLLVVQKRIMKSYKISEDKNSDPHKWFNPS